MLDVLSKLEKVREKYMEYILTEVNTSRSKYVSKVVSNI